MNELLISAKKAAALLSICPKQLRKLVDAGKVPVVPCGRSSRGDRYDPADIKEFIEQNKQRRKKCQSINAVKGITSRSRSTVNALEERLDRELRANKPRKSKQNSEQNLRIVK